MKRILILFAAVLALTMISCEKQEGQSDEITYYGDITFENQAEFNLTPDILQQLQEVTLQGFTNCSECVECIQVCTGMNGGYYLSYCCDTGDQ